MKIINYRIRNLEYRKGVFIPISTLIILFLVLLFSVSFFIDLKTDMIKDFFDYPYYIVAPIALIVAITLLYLVNLMMNSDYSLKEINPFDDVLKSVKKSKKHNTSSYDFKLFTDDNYYNLFISCSLK